MIDLSTIKHHPVIDEIAAVICNKTQNIDRGFYDVEVAYFLGKMAASMRVCLVTKDRGEIPVNIYALALATSGSGKGYSVAIMENEFLSGFKTRFMNETFPVISEDNLWKIAIERAARDGSDEQKEKEKLDREFKDAGALAFTFDSGTPAAVKQMRQKLLLANSGSINLQIDEIGSNLVGSTDILNVFLELYDQGIVKQKLTKNTKENVRSEELDGKTPTNMLLFGTPTKLLDGGQTEDHFYSFLETGYARRCLFGVGQKVGTGHGLTPDEIFKRLTDPANDAITQRWANHFSNLADPNRFGWKITVDDAVAIELIRYKVHCEKLANALPENEEILKSEISHRYYKCLKLAGAFAFIDESMELELDHLYQAMKLVEQSGDCFKNILRREKAYAKLARFLAGTGTEQTHADLHEQLPFYKSSITARNEMMSMAMAWGYKNHIIIKKTFSDGIEFFTGETLEETDLDRLTISHSNHMAFNYLNEHAPWSELHRLVTIKDYHWVNHHLKGGHRTAENVQPGFNLLVLDVDEGTPLAFAQELMADYTFMTYTTKRHQTEDYGDRFRLIMPINYRLMLDGDEYKEFMQNIVNWLPFKIDETANQRERKWLSNDQALIHYNDGAILDVLKFVPKTSKNEQFNKDFQSVANMDNLERWFAERMSSGNRNNTLLKFALALVDAGLTYIEIEGRVLNLNKQIQNPLTEDEIRNTVLITVAQKITTP